MTEGKKRGPKPVGTPEERAARRAQQIRDSQSRRRQNYIGHLVQLTKDEDAQLGQLALGFPGGKKGWITALVRAELERRIGKAK